MTGVVMGLLTALVGLPGALEPILWVVAYASWVVLLRALGEPRPFTTIVLAGGLTGLVTGAIQVALLPAYLRANPQWAADVGGRSRVAMIPDFVVFGVVMGLIFGVIFGLLAFVLQRRRA